MHLNIKSIALLLALTSGFVTAAADASSADGIYPLLKRLNPGERSQVFKSLNPSEQKQVFVKRINDYREDYPGELSNEQNEILDEAIQLVERGESTSHLLDAGAREAFGFQQFRRLLTTLDGDEDTTPAEDTGNVHEARGNPDCSCSKDDDWCDDGLHCNGFVGYCDTLPGCCVYDYWGCGTGYLKPCDGVCVGDDFWDDVDVDDDGTSDMAGDDFREDPATGPAYIIGSTATSTATSTESAATATENPEA